MAKHAGGSVSEDTVQPAPAADTRQSSGTQTPIEPEQQDAQGAETYKTTEQLAKENPKLSKRAILDLYARQFQADPPNPLAELLHKQEERKRLLREQAASGGTGAVSSSASG
ncbi:Hypothetical Protein RSSE_p0419 (plasmid) [Ralstonia solanacearum]|nr:Hypothetical Protein RSSE_p0419 [Ralstonia solanacearum]